MFGLLSELQPEQQAIILSTLNAKLLRFEESLVENGPFAVGATCTLADVHCAPFLYRFEITLKHFRSHSLLGAHARAASLLAACQELTEFKETTLTEAEYVQAYAPNANGFSKYSV